MPALTGLNSTQSASGITAKSTASSSTLSDINSEVFTDAPFKVPAMEKLARDQLRKQVTFDQDVSLLANQELAPSVVSASDDVVQALSDAARAAVEAQERLDATVRPYLDKENAFTYYETAKNAKGKATSRRRVTDNAEMSATDDAPMTTNDKSETTPPLSNLEDTPDITIGTATAEVNTPSSPTNNSVNASQTSNNSLGLQTPKITTSSDNVDSGNYGYPELTPLEAFEQYLDDAPELSYEELYHRTSVISSTMSKIQVEFEQVDKEIYEYEESEKAKSKAINDELKAAADLEQSAEDAVLAKLEKKFKKDLELSKKEWLDDFVPWWNQTYPEDMQTLDLLTKLRDPLFLSRYSRRMRALATQNHEKHLHEKPKPESKQTKEERDLEDRKRKGLTDRITFDDMVRADAYGYTYNPSDLNRGDQKMPNLRMLASKKSRAAKDKELEPVRESSRPKRNTNSGAVTESGGNSEAASGSDEEPEVPAKRSRAQTKKYVDMVPAGIDPAKDSLTYKDEDGNRRYRNSNKLCGRPANAVTSAGAASKGKGKIQVSRSKLDQMSLANSEDEEELADLQVRNENANVNGGLSNGQVLGSDQEDELQEAVQSLVHQTSPVLERKRAGKTKESVVDTIESMGPTAPKPRGRGGRPRKIVAAPDLYQTSLGEPGTALPLLPKLKRKPRRRKTRDADDDEDDLEPPIADAFMSETASQDPSRASSRPRSSRGASRTPVPPAAFYKVKTPRKLKQPLQNAPFTADFGQPSMGQNGNTYSPYPPLAPVEIKPKLARKTSGKRKRGADNPLDQTVEGFMAASGNNSDGEGGLAKKPKRNRLKTAEEKETQSSVMKNKWADPNSAMRVGILRRKRRDLRKKQENTRILHGGLENPDVVYKSDAEGFSYAYWNETPPAPTPPVPAVSQANGGIKWSDEAGKFEVKVENPEAREPVSPLPTSRVGRVSKPTRKIVDGGVPETSDYEDEEEPENGEVNEEDEEDEENEREEKSVYETFQELTSPGHQLGKRVSKPVSNFTWGTSDSEDFISDAEFGRR